MQFLVNSNFNFIGKRKTARIFSIALILIGMGSLVIQGGPKLGIDFTGGTSLRLQFEKGVSIGEVRSAIASLGIGTADALRTAGNDRVDQHLPNAHEAGFDRLWTILGTEVVVFVHTFVVIR